jgi:tetratricopeptide (TPR) repeat protein
MAAHMARLGDIEAAHSYSAKAFSVSRTERPGDYLLRNLALSCEVNETVLSERFELLGAENPDLPFSSVQTLHVLVQMLQDNACPAFDQVGFANRMADMFLQESLVNKGSPDIYFSLAVLENSLQRYENAYAYVEKFLIMSPHSKRGMLMKLHFASALGKVDERDRIIETLLDLDQRGDLTVGERQTLALYLGQ